MKLAERVRGPGNAITAETPLDVAAVDQRVGENRCIILTINRIVKTPAILAEIKEFLENKIIGEEEISANLYKIHTILDAGEN